MKTIDRDVDQPARVVLAIDPGSAKCGIAVVSHDGKIVFRAICRSDMVSAEVSKLIEEFHPVQLLLGDGTGHKPILKHLLAAHLAIPVVKVDESFTSETARIRFLAENSPRDWQWILPLSLRTPPVPYDDYVAVILAERYWDMQRAENEDVASGSFSKN